MKRIVVGVDGSPEATRAAERAAELAHGLGAELHVVCAYEHLEVERLRQGSEVLVRSTEADAEEKAVGVAKELQARHQTLVLAPYAVEGKPGEVLVRVAEEHDADIIVVGNKRVQGLARVLGSIARDVASRAHCDVFVAHTHER
ncbi:universal stress protein [Gordonia sp. zg691]|uniref:Universal stress protein n=1 Tax=Gordonia jinghuaiqii TaxID=2758710 RepID=A0A7D7QXY0_9ACTN|nr:universal stress protein [Gordonia jinghuaiqii]MBD0862864.1 universal stress protein [Gordonia jinghuaiqii]MCR5979004.1 universal stress protein [Gordonia jinghuaiqii]QMT01668.1 universal stress protein [Gordonia jinghuaiqii]